MAALGYDPIGGLIAFIVILLALSASALGIASAGATFVHERRHPAPQPA